MNLSFEIQTRAFRGVDVFMFNVYTENRTKAINLMKKKILRKLSYMDVEWAMDGFIHILNGNNKIHDN